MKCPFLHFESDCIGGECPLFLSSDDMAKLTNQIAAPASCGLKVLSGFFFGYRRDCSKMLQEVEDLGKRLSRKIDDHDSQVRRRY